MKKFEFFIVAGEESGDYHGSCLLSAINKRIPGSHFHGIGGNAMEAEGCQIHYHVKQMAVTGLTEVFGRIPFFYSVLKWAVCHIQQHKPHAIILIDYPDFNLRLAKRVAKFNIPIIYYISPQMWAWRSGRVKLIRKYIDKMFVLFPFEEQWYRERGVEAEYVGNSVLDKFVEIPAKMTCRERYDFNPEECIICMMPGSRNNEIKRMLPVMVDAAEKLVKKLPDCRFIIPVATTLNAEIFEKIYAKSRVKIELFQRSKPDLLRASDFAWVTSGTATLEVALARTPMIIGYRTSPFTFWLAKKMVNTQFIGMANLVAETKVAEELLQYEFNSDKIVDHTLRLLSDKAKLNIEREKLAIVQSRLGHPNAADRVAEGIIEMME